MRGWDNDGVYYRTQPEYWKGEKVRVFANLAQVKYAMGVIKKKDKVDRFEIIDVGMCEG